MMDSCQIFFYLYFRVDIQLSPKEPLDELSSQKICFLAMHSWGQREIHFSPGHQTLGERVLGRFVFSPLSYAISIFSLLMSLADWQKMYVFFFPIFREIIQFL